MARQAQTDIAVLGALSIQPMTGYQMRQAITDVLGHFWHESYGQIYPCLSDLAAQGLISARAGTRPSSSVYEITDAGREHLVRRLREDPEPQSPRNATLLRVFFGASLDPGDLAALLDQAEADALTRLGVLSQIREEIASDPLAGTHGRFWLATVSAGEHSARATLDWVAQTRRELLSD